MIGRLALLGFSPRKPDEGQAIYRWKSKDAGMGVSDAKGLKELEWDNAELMHGKWRISQERARLIQSH